MSVNRIELRSPNYEGVQLDKTDIAADKSKGDLYIYRGKPGFLFTDLKKNPADLTISNPESLLVIDADEVEMPKTSAQAFTATDLVYVNLSTSEATTSSSGTVLVGRATKDAAASDASVFVRWNQSISGEVS